MKDLKSYWQNLNEREHWMIIGAILIMSFYVFYAFIYSPLTQAVMDNTVQLKEKRETLQWMKTIQNQSVSRKSKEKLTNSQLLTLLSNKLKDKSAPKFPYQLQQTGTGEIQLTFDRVPFEIFSAWLNSISENYTIYIKQLSADRTGTPGVVKLLVIISATT